MFLHLPGIRHPKPGMLWTEICSESSNAWGSLSAAVTKLNFTPVPRGLVKHIPTLPGFSQWQRLLCCAWLLRLRKVSEVSQLSARTAQGVQALPLTPLQLLLLERNQRVNPAGASLLLLSYLRKVSPVPAFCSCLPWRASLMEMQEGSWLVRRKMILWKLPGSRI